MLNQVILEISKNQRPYYYQQGNTIKGIDNQYWLVFKHRDADNLLTNLASFLGLVEKQTAYKLFRIDLNNAVIVEYSSKNDTNLPNTTLLRTSKIAIIEQFLLLEKVTEEKSLNEGTFRELDYLKKRRFNLPQESPEYINFLTAYLARANLYRRSTAYFNSGVLKLYEEPLFNLVINEGKIHLLMDWQGFTNKRDIKILEQIHNQEAYIKQTLTDFLQGLEAKSFHSTAILAELVRLNILTIKTVKMQEGKSIYHKKTGILTDSRNNSILHEGSDNFTLSAQTVNAESVTVLYDSDPLDIETIKGAIIQFDQEWHNEEITFDLSDEFLQQILREKERRDSNNQPKITEINPDEIPAGETTKVEFKGENLGNIDKIEIPNNSFIEIKIESQQEDVINTEITIDNEHPPQTITEFRFKEKSGIYHVEKNTNTKVKKELIIPDYPEIEGFKDAIALILEGKHGQPEDFVYWLAQQKPHLLRVEDSDLLVELVNDGILFEHQKSGSQHCYRIMQDFGVAVCADAVGLGKTRLASAVAKLYQHNQGQVRIAIIASKKLHSNWEREMRELGFRKGDYELYNKNLMSRKNSNFFDDFNRFGGADLVIIDEVHEGIRNYNNRIHKTCLRIRQQDINNNRQRYYLLLTATPWNNRREDIYNILSPFLTRPEGFTELGFPSELAHWFNNREIGVENFTDNTPIFRNVYRELFLQRTRKMLRDATPDLNLYAKRVAEWLPVQFEPKTETALEQIFTQFEDSLFIPFADPIRYFTDTVEVRSLLRNQRRMFLQRAESSMYALRRTIKNFSDRILLLQRRLESVTANSEGLKQFLLLHYDFITENELNQDELEDNLLDFDNWEEGFEEDEEEEETDNNQEDSRQQLRTSIDLATDNLTTESAIDIYQRMLTDCDSDLEQLREIESLLKDEFITDHKREIVTAKVRELVKSGHKVLLISTFADTVIDYYRYMAQDTIITSKGIGMAMGGNKRYFNDNQIVKVNKHNLVKNQREKKGITRLELFRLFAPSANAKDNKPSSDEEIAVLIGSETLSIGQNLQDADYLINIDLPWNPMILEQRIGRIDRPKQHKADYIYIYYANSESQLLRQASRLNNLHKKLVGDLAEDGQKIPEINDLGELGASVYGDTSFDDEILPGYIDFIQSLVKVRKMEQDNIQEKTYNKQETAKDLYTENEILQSEELKKLVQRLGDDYIPNPISLGKLNNSDSAHDLLALTINYFGPNNEPLPDKQEVIYWNNLTGEEDAYGRSIALSFQTPEYHEVVSASVVIERANSLYEKLMVIKRDYEQNLEREDSTENINISSERVSRIQKRIREIDSFPDGINRKIVKETLNKLNQHKQNRQVQKLLKQFTDGDKNKLGNDDFINQLVDDTDKLSLIDMEVIKPSKLKLSLSALLMLI